MVSLSDEPAKQAALASRAAEWRTGCGAVLAAAIAMAATLPGRTHGLGMITTRLLADFQSLSEVGYATLNLWATILGSLLCIPCGWILDRASARVTSFAVVSGLGLSVWFMSVTDSVLGLACALTLTRCLGQSMLSVISINIIGKRFPHRPGWVMGIYAVLLTILMVVVMGLLQSNVVIQGWRLAWRDLGWGLLVAAPILAVLIPRSRAPGPAATDDGKGERESSATLGQALRSSCFWSFAVAISLFGLISSGFSLFQQTIFAAQGLEEAVYHRVLLFGLAVGLAANLAAGGLTTYVRPQRLLSAAMLLLAGSLAAVPFIRTPTQAYAFCVAYSVAGGVLTVVFFAIWAPAFGSVALGRIQGAAQMLTVVFSAAGPICVSGLRAASGSDTLFLVVFAILSVTVGAGAWFVVVPSAAAGDWRAPANNVFQSVAASDAAS